MGIIDGTGKLPRNLPAPATTPGTVVVVQKVLLPGKDGRDGADGLPGDPGPAGPPLGLATPSVPNAVVQQKNTDGTYFSGPMTLDQFLPSYSFSFSPSFATALEIGQSLATPAFTAEYPDGRPPVAAALTDDAGSLSKDVILTPTAFSSVGTFHYGVITTVNFSLTANEQGGPGKTQRIAANWLKRFVIAYAPTGLSAADLRNILNNTYVGEAGYQKVLTTSRARTIGGIVTGSNKKLWVLYPTSFGAGSFTLGGFAGGLLDSQTFTYTNPFSAPVENFFAYESTNANLGSSTPIVLGVS